MPYIACKLPTGLQIDHDGQTIILAGANFGENLEMVSMNGRPADNARRAHGFGLTKLTDKEAEAFEAWSKSVTFKEGVPANGKLSQPFPALENGSILGPFATIDEARKECAAIASAVTTGFEGLDPEKEGTESVAIEAAEEETKPKRGRPAGS